MKRSLAPYFTFLVSGRALLRVYMAPRLTLCCFPSFYHRPLPCAVAVARHSWLGSSWSSVFGRDGRTIREGRKGARKRRRRAGRSFVTTPTATGARRLSFSFGCIDRYVLRMPRVFPRAHVRSGSCSAAHPSSFNVEADVEDERFTRSHKETMQCYRTAVYKSYPLAV